MKSFLAAFSLFGLVSCSSTPVTEAPLDVAATRAWLQEFTAKYSYDTGYMQQLLDVSPASYQVFAAAMAMAEHRVHLPVDGGWIAG